jgi:hypothetical protein
VGDGSSVDFVSWSLAFCSGRHRNDHRWLTRFPRLDRAVLLRSGALQSGMRTEWVLKGGTGVASAVHIACTARQDGLEIRTGDQVQVVTYWYDTLPWRGLLRQFFKCPTCERICRTLFFDRHWGCRVCLELEYPIKASSGRVVAAYQIEDMRRSLIKTRPGSQQWKELRARIAALHTILSADVARIRRDLRRRLKNDYRR